MDIETQAQLPRHQAPNDSVKKHPTVGDYILVKTLGSGYNSKVKLGYNKNNGQYYAVKIMKNTSTVSAMKVTKNEVNIMKELNHPNIVNLIEFNENGEYYKTNGQMKKVVYIVLELAQGGELFEYVANTGKFSEEVCRTYFQQIIDALAYCHNKGICHRDMKPENLLFDEQFNLKIADFGFSTLLHGKDGNGKLHTILGTESYMAPEINMRMPYKGEQVDLFATGIILFIMFAGTPPFTKADPKDPYYKLICNGKNDTFWAAHARYKPNKDFFPPDFKDLLNKMLAFDPSHRITLEQIQQHPFFNGPAKTMDQVRQEFFLRRQKVTEELEKERLRKALEKEKKKNTMANNVMHGHAGFRSVNDGQGVAEFVGLESEFPSLKLKRELEPKEVQAQLTDFYSGLEPDYLLKYLLSFATTARKDEQKEFEQAKLSDKTYKVTLTSAEEGDNVEIDVKILKVDDDINCVEFSRKAGQCLNYYNKVNLIKEHLQKLNNDQQ